MQLIDFGIIMRLIRFNLFVVSHVLQPNSLLKLAVMSYTTDADGCIVAQQLMIPLRNHRRVAAGCWAIVLPSQRRLEQIFGINVIFKQSTIGVLVQTIIPLENNDFSRHKQLKPKGRAHITDTTTTNFASHSLN